MAPANDIAALVTTLAQLAERLAAAKEADAQLHSRPMPPRVLFTVAEAGAQLGVGRTTAFALVASGELESVQIGRLRRVHIDAIRDYAARLVANAKKPDAA
ncbi:DNA binding domain-containing protein, excisionase family [Amycolatopsis tolypomycina]|uniref:DNA binding domain-containing protein, excisionase family n=1 Tax=Amycolatopsis tolypomycina TaxID=208445 RepID=A0A1H4JQH5_9PSEU|nr:excisionase family DNA-binding protein [Amycolatopsis tolypomycina]SEB48560.1 DNA binding domain-containing protein, excisionase family [Amycolatopsis tolypomycina]SEB49103.1 DNA binding domain-containing protein, excisionase family [Amycolatopsis tolypomycina]